MTPADVTAWHAAEAQRHVLIARNWANAADKLDPATNAVRLDGMKACAREAMAIAKQHLDMAHALEPLMGKPLTFGVDLGREPAIAMVRPS